MVLCVYVHMQVSAKMSVCVDTLNTTTTFEPLTVFSMNNLAFCQLALKSEPAGSSFCQNGFRQTLEPRTSKLSHHSWRLDSSWPHLFLLACQTKMPK